MSSSITGPAIPGVSGGALASIGNVDQIRSIADWLPQLAWSCRPDGYCDYLSRKWVEYTGVEEWRHHGQGWLDSVHPEDRLHTHQVWADFIAGRQKYDVDYRLRRHDGAYLWFKTRGVLVRDDAGQPLRVLGTTTDIDAQKRAEDRYRESRERLDAALSASGTGTFRWDILTNALDWDEPLDRLFGLPPGKTVRSLDTFIECVHPDDRQGVIDRCRRCRDEGADFAMEFRVVLPEGTMRWLDDRGRTFRDASGRPAWMTGACVDITERKLAEARIREIDDREQFVRKASGVGFWYCDLPFDVLEWDDLVKEHFHLPGDVTVTIETFYERIHPDDRQKTRQAIERSITQKTGYDVYYRTVHPSTGAEKWIRAIGRTWYAADGTPRRFDGVTLDATLQRRSEERQRFLSEFALATQSLSDPEQIIAVAARLLAEHLHADRCAYAAVENESVYFITGDCCRGVPSIIGRWPVASFGAEHLALMLANEPHVVHDAEHDPRIGGEDLQAFRATSIQAMISVPLRKNGRFTAGMAVHQAKPRRWTDEEVDLVRSVASRCWEALERARAARLLCQSEEELRLITDSVPALIAFVSTDATYRFVNRQYEAWFRKPRHEIEGRHLREVFGDTAYEPLKPFVERALAGEQVEFEALAPYPSGARHIHAVLVPRFVDGAVTGYLSLITDVTERVRSRELLQASERRFREMADTAPVALWLTDPDGACTFLSREWYEFTGQTEEEALGLGWTKAIHPDDRERAGDEFVEANRARETFRNEYRLRGRDGNYRWAIDVGRPRFNQSGEYLGMVGAVFDIEEKTQAETALRDADRKKDEFLAILAHELRNPLAPLRNGLQVLRLAGSDTKTAEQARGMMDRQLAHMVRLIDDLLDVSRISRNKMELRKTRVTLAKVIENAVETVRPLLDARGHELFVDLPSEPIHLHVDLTRLAQVFSNLLTNAAKYTQPGGKIWLTAEAREAEALVMVRDTGVGIPRESLSTIFQMFGQVDRSLERTTGGLGIGLALVKGLVEMHGGNVFAASDGEGAGSTFTVALPRDVAANAGELQNGSPTSASPSPSRRVLVVDDNRDSADSMAAMLRILGHHVRIAHDGVEAIAEADAFRPDVVLMDIGMPRLNGYDATRRLRERPWGSSVTVVALTGWGQDGDRENSRVAGCDGHLVKPVLLDDLLPYLADQR
jgi:PAS domain S-box-containing protein